MRRSWRGSRWGEKERKEGKGESGGARGKRKEAARVGGGGSGCCLYSWGKERRWHGGAATTRSQGVDNDVHMDEEGVEKVSGPVSGRNGPEERREGEVGQKEPGYV